MDPTVHEKKAVKEGMKTCTLQEYSMQLSPSLADHLTILLYEWQLEHLIINSSKKPSFFLNLYSSTHASNERTPFGLYKFV